MPALLSRPCRDDFDGALGASWQVIGSRQSSITPRFVGLLAGQGYDAEESADFDYFTLRPLP